MIHPESFLGRLARISRAAVMVSAGLVPLASPILCMLIVGFLVFLIVIGHHAYAMVLQTPLLAFFRSYEHQLLLTNRVLQVVAGLGAFMFFARSLQLCYPEKYDPTNVEYR